MAIVIAQPWGICLCHLMIEGSSLVPSDAPWGKGEKQIGVKSGKILKALHLLLLVHVLDISGSVVNRALGCRPNRRGVKPAFEVQKVNGNERLIN
jgi:hypothetical protein